MLKEETILVETKGFRKLGYLESIGYDISGDSIQIKIRDLNRGSRQLIIAICDYCNREISVEYKEYIRNESKGGKYACSKKCGSLKAKDTNMVKWGVDYPMMLVETQNKTKRTNLSRYGVEFLQQSIDIRNKTKKKVMEKWGVDHISKSEIIRLRTSKISSDINYLRYIGNNISEFSCPKGHTFFINNDNYYHRNKSSVSICTVCDPIGDSQSLKEIDLFKFIRSVYSGEIIQSYRKESEIDIYLPDLKIGFEFNGLRWHSDEFKDKTYHINKTKYFNDMGIRIFHIWEDDWFYKRSILESQIKNKLGLVDKIYARKCSIGDLKSSSDFLNNNHIQGSDRSSIKIGLYYNDDLVSVMTFNKIEGRKKMKETEWNLSRFCNKSGISVIGGASKMLSYFINKHSPTRIISYADRDWSVGELYEKIGFNFCYYTKPDYKYLINYKRVHKSNFKKSIIGGNLSEFEEMRNKGINRIWDCGKIKFEKIICS